MVRADVHSRNIRHRNKIAVPLFRATTGQQSFVYRAVRLLDELPQSLTVKINTLPNFKAAFRSRTLGGFLGFLFRFIAFDIERTHS